MAINIEQVIRDYLPGVLHLSLATCKDNKPWVCEVHFAYDNDLNLYFRSLTSRRHSQEIAANPFVAGNIVKECTLNEPCKGVIDFEGTANLLGPGPEQDKAFACIKERLKTGDDILAQTKDPEGHQFYKITIDTWHIFGNFEGHGNQKHSLGWTKNRG